MEGKLVIISAPSGAGKTTIVNHLLRKGLGLEFSISATTRRPRGKEKTGKEYYFISITDFKERIRNKEFVEWEEVYKDQFYGTLRSEIDRIWSEKKHVLFDVDVRGGINLKSIFGHQAISVFIMPPSVNELEKRLLGRATDDPSKIKIRLGKAIEEMKLADQFDHIVINENLEQAQNNVYQMVKSFVTSNQ
ncbi:MAG: guanylate kinase [Bacteroidetes bacterium RBG_13_42_15]|nr:MAG: guanylate kinase [Bacteroidetes bacterium RBG_13_42_15]